MKVTKFGLRHKKTDKVLGVYRNPNSGDACDIQHILDGTEDEMWLVDEAINAEWVRHNSTRWYNANYETPTHYFDPNDTEVVEVVVETNIKTVEVKIPTIIEFYKRKYAKDPEQLERARRLISENLDMSYSLYDLRMLLGKE
jgi:hypothetical protein